MAGNFVSYVVKTRLPRCTDADQEPWRRDARQKAAEQMYSMVNKPAHPVHLVRVQERVIPNPASPYDELQILLEVSATFMPTQALDVLHAVSNVVVGLEAERIRTMILSLGNPTNQGKCEAYQFAIAKLVGLLNAAGMPDPRERIAGDDSE
jgi:hypothetical protein